MLVLNLKKEPFWIELLAGVRVQLKPITTPLVIAARVQAIKILGDNPQDGSVWASTFLTCLAQASIMAWEGIVGEDGKEVPLTSDNVAAFMGNIHAYDAFDALYYRKVDLLEQEKNA